MKYNGLLYKSLHRVTRFLSSVQWGGLKAKLNNGVRYEVTQQEREHMAELLKRGHYLILTEHKTYLTTYLIGLLTYFKTKQWPTYVHILMNLDVGTKENEFGFKLMEATNKGVHYSSFEEVFGCDNICIIEPKNMDLLEWALVQAELSTQLGKNYDDFFDIKDDTHVSCVEMCLESLKALSTFEADFPHLDAMIKSVGNLTPQMYRDCLDFTVIYETKHG